MKTIAEIARNTSVVVALLLLAQPSCVGGQYCPSCAGGMCSSCSAGWQPSAAPRTRIVAELAPQQSPASDTQSLPAHDAHCRIFVGDGSTGSGTLIARNSATGLILTCSHLFDDSSADVVAAFPDGSRYGARLTDRDPTNDLAALLIKRPKAGPIEVDDAEPTGTLTACGYGGDGRFRPVNGTISGAVQAIGASFPSVKITGAVRPGDSGGGVMNAAAQLVGVVWGCRDGETYFTCDRPLREFLDHVWPRRNDRESKVERRETRQDTPTAANAQSPAPSPDLSARLDKIESDVATLHTSKQDRGEYLQVGDLNGYAKRADVPAIDASKFATHDEVAGVESAAKNLVESLHTKLHEQLDAKLTQIMPAVEQQIAASNPGLATGLSYGGAIIGWTTFETNVPARIQPDRTVVVTKAGEPPTSDSFFKVVLGVQVPLDHTYRIVGPDSAVYELVEYTQAERIDALPVAQVKKVP